MTTSNSPCDLRDHAAGRRLLSALVVAIGAHFAIPAAAASDRVDTVVVRLREEAVPTTAATLPAHVREALGTALWNGITTDGRDRDGAWRLSFDHPLPFTAARDAVNRVRLLPDVVYASVGAAAGTAAVPKIAAGTPQRPIDRMIVRYRDPSLALASDRNEVLPEVELERLASASGQPIARARAMSGGAWVVQLFRSLDVAQAAVLAASIAADPAVEYAEPDLPMYPMLVPTDPAYAASQWDLKTSAQSAGGANLPAAWDLTTGSDALYVAVLDTGILAHPDLATRYAPGYDMIADALVANDGNGRDADASDPGDWITSGESASGYFAGCPVGNSSWHGTHVSGTVAAAAGNGIGIAGINWTSKVLPVRVLGKCGGYTSDIADAIRWAAGLPVTGVPGNATPARVVNLSLGGGGGCGTTMQGAITAALGAGTVIAVAAGNANADAVNFSPANCSGVITVAATQAAGARASYSNYGTSVEIAAPGGGDGNAILSTLNSGATSPVTTGSGWIYAGYNGTSMATPHVAGIASLMLSVNPALTPAQVLSKIQTTARAFPTGTGRDCTANPAAATATVRYCGAGIIDAGAAVAAAADVAPAPTTTTLASSLNPSTAGAAVTFTATVAGTNPTGSVDFRDGAISVPGCGAVTLSGGGASRTAQCTTASLTVATHAMTAVYVGDAAHTASTSAVLSQVVNAGGSGAATTTTLVSAPNPSSTGQTVTFTATVGDGASPTGTVDFRDGGTSIAGCTAAPVVGSVFSGGRRATCRTGALAAGAHTVTATYSGDAANAASTSAPITQNVGGSGAVATATVLASAPNPSTVGQSVVFTATVTGSNPTGSVNFRDGATSVSGCSAVALAGSGASRTAQCTTSALTPGTHSVTAVYEGDAGNLTSTSAALAQVVNAAGGPVATTTAIASSANPSAAGASVTFTATVQGTAPTGTVSFRDGAATVAGCGAVSLTGTGNSRTAACATSALAAGVHVVTAAYGGDAANQASTSAPLMQDVVATCVPAPRKPC